MRLFQALLVTIILSLATSIIVFPRSAFAVVRSCSRCHHSVQATWNFCKYCGLRLASPAQAPSKLVVRCNAQEALITLDRKPFGLRGQAVPVAPGKHLLEVQCKGYVAQELPVTVGIGRSLTVEVTLQKLPSTFTVRRTGTADEVFVDGRSYGPSPTTITLPPGKHHLEVRIPHHRTVEREIFGLPGSAEEEVIQLIPIPGKLAISDSGEPDQVLLDGKPIGVSPLTVTEVNPGVHVVTVTAAGYRPFRQEVAIDPESESTVAPLLVREAGQISVSDSGVLDSLYLDGKPVGATPKVLSDIPSGTHTIRVAANGYRAFEQAVDVQDLQTSEVRPKLQPSTGSIRILSTGHADTVLVDDVERGSSPLVIATVSVGPHRIRVTARDYLPFEATVVVESDKEVVVIPMLREVGVSPAGGTGGSVSFHFTGRGSLAAREVTVSEGTPSGLREFLQRQSDTGGALRTLSLSSTGAAAASTDRQTWAPNAVIDKCKEVAAVGEGILGAHVTTNGWLVVSDKHWNWTGIPDDVSTILKERSNAGAMLLGLSVSSSGDYFVVTDKGTWWKVSDPVLREKLREFSEAKEAIIQATFGANGAWAVVTEKRMWSSGLQPEAQRKIQELVRDGHRILGVELGLPNQWAILSSKG